MKRRHTWVCAWMAQQKKKKWFSDRFSEHSGEKKSFNLLTLFWKLNQILIFQIKKKEVLEVMWKLLEVWARGGEGGKRLWFVYFPLWLNHSVCFIINWSSGQIKVWNETWLKVKTHTRVYVNAVIFASWEKFHKQFLNQILHSVSSFLQTCLLVKWSKWLKKFCEFSESVWR